MSLVMAGAVLCLYLCVYVDTVQRVIWRTWSTTNILDSFHAPFLPRYIYAGQS